MSEREKKVIQLRFGLLDGHPRSIAGRPSGYVLGSACIAARQALTAGQTPAFLVSFHTATP